MATEIAWAPTRNPQISAVMVEKGTAVGARQHLELLGLRLSNLLDRTGSEGQELAKQFLREWIPEVPDQISGHFLAETLNDLGMLPTLVSRKVAERGSLEAAKVLRAEESEPLDGLQAFLSEAEMMR